MKKMRFLLMTLMATSLVFLASCKDDDDIDVCEEHTATFDGDVQAIIDLACAYSGCHDGTGSNTFIPVESNDFTNYAGMMHVLDSGKFNTRALVDMDMPPAAFVPAGSPTELTAEQLEILNCWKDAGYPEN